MKKSTLIIILTVFVLALFTACTEEENPTELRWRNEATQLEEIRWVNYEDTNDIDQTWDGDFTTGTTTDFKEVDLLNGQGIGANGGLTYRLESGSDYNFVLDEGSSETITVDSYTEL
ncbi:MAG TPA: hypothetical protein PK573_07920 [Spirochaetota bacterium]|nr:hypothetical protein [Spirochaetota bacterium]HRZ25746.1 hypothetical protein [Spirochaetota bacterium]HSA13233.1 hypothetical protein [Spirochaetota bacterium]